MPEPDRGMAADCAERALLQQMPVRPAGKSRLDRLMAHLDAGMRGRKIQQED